MGKPKLLIVEDNLVANEMLALAFADRFDTKQALDGWVGIELLSWADFVCVDGEFPFNAEFYSILKASGKPFVIYSGRDTKEAVFRNVGEVAYVQKPKLPDLQNAVQTFFLGIKLAM